MPVRETSLIALEELKGRLEPNQWKVYEILSEIGPAHDQRILEALNQKEQLADKPKRYKRIWAINQVTGRRNELVGLQLVKCLGQYSGIWNGRKKTYCFWAVQGDLRQPAGWVRLADKPLPELPDKCAQCPYRRQSHLAAIRGAGGKAYPRQNGSQRGGTYISHLPAEQKERTKRTDGNGVLINGIKDEGNV